MLWFTGTGVEPHATGLGSEVAARLSSSSSQGAGDMDDEADSAFVHQGSVRFAYLVGCQHRFSELAPGAPCGVEGIHGNAWLYVAHGRFFYASVD